jgi:hypothetical protein
MSGTTQKELKRGFGGKIDNFESKAERAFEKKHLKAYLKGHKQFRHGHELDGKPKWFRVNDGMS